MDKDIKFKNNIYKQVWANANFGLGQQKARHRFIFSVVELVAIRRLDRNGRLAIVRRRFRSPFGITRIMVPKDASSRRRSLRSNPGCVDWNYPLHVSGSLWYLMKKLGLVRVTLRAFVELVRECVDWWTKIDSPINILFPKWFCSPLKRLEHGWCHDGEKIAADIAERASTW